RCTEHEILLFVAVAGEPGSDYAGHHDEGEDEPADDCKAVAAQPGPRVFPQRCALLELDDFFHGAHARVCIAVRRRGLSQAASRSDSRLNRMMSPARKVVVPRII